MCTYIFVTTFDFLESRKFSHYFYFLKSRIFGTYRYFYFLESSKVICCWQHCCGHNNYLLTDDKSVCQKLMSISLHTNRGHQGRGLEVRKHRQDNILKDKDKITWKLVTRTLLRMTTLNKLCEISFCTVIVVTQNFTQSTGILCRLLVNYLLILYVLYIHVYTCIQT